MKTKFKELYCYGCHRYRVQKYVGKESTNVAERVFLGVITCGMSEWADPPDKYYECTVCGKLNKD